MTEHTTTGSVFDDLGFSDEEASNLKVRASLMQEILHYMKTHRLTQKQAAKLLGVTQPRISDLKRGKIQRFTVDMLIKMFNRMGKHIEFKVDGSTLLIV